MSKIHLFGAALIAATVTTACADKKCNCPEDKNCKCAESAECKCADGAECKCAETAPAAAEKKDPNEVVMNVNGKTLTRGAIDADINKVVALYGDKIPAEQLEGLKQQASFRIAQQFMIETILGDKAAELGYTITDEELQAQKDALVKQLALNPTAPKTFDEFLEKDPRGKDRAMAEFKTGALIDKMLKAEVADKDTTDYSIEAKKTLDMLKEKNDKAVEAAAAAEPKIKELKAELDKTPDAEKAAKFGELAEKHSACPSGKRAKGDLGEFGHGMMVPEFDKAAFELEVGKISEPVKTQFGYHLIMVTEKKDDKVRASHILISTPEVNELPSLEDVTETLKKNGSRKAVGEFIKKTVMAARIKAEGEFKMLVPPAEEE